MNWLFTPDGFLVLTFVSALIAGTAGFVFPRVFNKGTAWFIILFSVAASVYLADLAYEASTGRTIERDFRTFSSNYLCKNFSTHFCRPVNEPAVTTAPSTAGTSIAEPSGLGSASRADIPKSSEQKVVTPPNSGSQSAIKPKAIHIAEFGIWAINVGSSPLDVPGWESSSGVFVDRVDSDSIASIAGLKSGDVIYELDGVETADVTAFSDMFRKLPPDYRAKVNIFRKSDYDYAFFRTPGPIAAATFSSPFLGFTTKTNSDGHLVLQTVETTSQAWEKGLRPGDIITEATQKKVSGAQSLKDLSVNARLKGRKSVLLLVLRNNDPRFVALSLEGEVQINATQELLGLRVYNHPNGLVISEVDENSEAFEKGLIPGDVIAEVAQEKINGFTRFRELVEISKEAGRKTVLLLVRRGGDPRFVALSI